MADGCIGDALRQSAAMPTVPILTPAIALVTSDGYARPWDLERIVEGTCGSRHASKQQAWLCCRLSLDQRDGWRAVVVVIEGALESARPRRGPPLRGGRDARVERLARALGAARGRPRGARRPWRV